MFYTDVIDPRASQSLIAHTTRGAHHHLPIVVALRNEALVAAASLEALLPSQEPEHGPLRPVNPVCVPRLVEATRDVQNVRCRTAGLKAMAGRGS